MPSDSYKSESFKQVSKINGSLPAFRHTDCKTEVYFPLIGFAQQQRSKNQTGIKMAKYARNRYSQ